MDRLNPTFAATARAEVFDNYVLFAYPTLTAANDTILVYDLLTKAFVGVWTGHTVDGFVTADEQNKLVAFHADGSYGTQAEQLLYGKYKDHQEVLPLCRGGGALYPSPFGVKCAPVGEWPLRTDTVWGSKTLNRILGYGVYRIELELLFSKSGSIESTPLWIYDPAESIEHPAYCGWAIRVYADHIELAYWDWDHVRTLLTLPFVPANSDGRWMTIAVGYEDAALTLSVTDNWTGAKHHVTSEGVVGSLPTTSNWHIRGAGSSGASMKVLRLRGINPANPEAEDTVEDYDMSLPLTGGTVESAIVPADTLELNVGKTPWEAERTTDMTSIAADIPAELLTREFLFGAPLQQKRIGAGEVCWLTRDPSLSVSFKPRGQNEHAALTAKTYSSTLFDYAGVAAWDGSSATADDNGRQNYAPVELPADVDALEIDIDREAEHAEKIFSGDVCTGVQVRIAGTKGTFAIKSVALNANTMGFGTRSK